eukprot:11625660-Alexandrium_andersonii.AAC.1
MVKAWSDRPQAAYDELEQAAEKETRELINKVKGMAEASATKEIKKLMRKHGIPWTAAFTKKAKASAASAGSGGSAAAAPEAVCRVRLDQQDWEAE